jgi:hypothetical protein
MWLFLVALIPVLPRLKSLEVAGQTVLLDELVLVLALVAVGTSRLARIAVSGRARLGLSRIWVFFALLILWKTIVLFVSSLFLQWTPQSDIQFLLGQGVHLNEGILVLGKSVALLAIFAITYADLQEVRDCRRAMMLYFFSVAAVVGVALYQFVVLDHPVLTSTFRNMYILGLPYPYGLGLSDPWGQPSMVGHEHLGAYMIIAASLLVGCLLHDWPSQKRGRRLVSALFLGCVFCLLFTSSRGTWIGCGFTGLAWGWHIFKTRRVLRGIRLVFPAIGFIALVGAFGEVDLVDYMYSRTEALFSAFDGKLQDPSAIDRLRLLGKLWDVFLDHPLVGLGAGGAGRMAESQFMRELVEGGVVGTTIFLVLASAILKMALQTYRESREAMHRAVAIGLFCGSIGVLGQALFTDLLIVTKVSVPFWFLVAVVQRMHSLTAVRPIDQMKEYR